MALPEITVPFGTPPFLVAGHGITESDLFANSIRATGHRRKRRLYTVPERRVAVSLFLEAAEMAAFDAWFENVLRVGSLPFAAQVANQDAAGTLWWTAFWDAPYQADPTNLGRWLVTGTLLLTGEGSATGPVSTSSQLAVGMALTGSVSITVPQSISLAVGMELIHAQSAGAIAFGFALTTPITTYRLREASGFRLREASGKRERESIHG